MFDPHKLKLLARHLSFRTILMLILLASFCLPFSFIFIALSSLENVDGCRSTDCLYFGRKGGQAAAKVLPEVDIHEETLRVAQMQRALYRHFASKGIPKGLHCLSLILTIEHSTNPKAQETVQNAAERSRLTDNSLKHFVLITDNVLAASVVVGSAVKNARNPETYVFHIVTERMSYAAMKAWFALNPPHLAVVEVVGVHQFKWIDRDSLPVLEMIETSEGLRRHYYGDHALTDSTSETPGSFTAKLAARNPKYVSIMNHLRMYLPQNMQENLSLWRLGTLPPSLIAFDHHMLPIDPAWHMLGLGYFQESKLDSIENSALIHFNGAAKPWLDLAIPEFRPFWSKYVNYSNPFLRQCNIYDL